MHLKRDKQTDPADVVGAVVGPLLACPRVERFRSFDRQVVVLHLLLLLLLHPHPHDGALVGVHEHALSVRLLVRSSG